MKKLLLFLWIVGIFFGCAPKQAEQPQEALPQEEEVVFTLPDFIKIRPGERVELNSPRVFWDVTILLNYEQKKWLQANTNGTSDEEAHIRLQRQRALFFEGLGLSEDMYNQYSFDHYPSIQEFIEKNPQYKEAYEASQSL